MGTIDEAFSFMEVEEVVWVILPVTSEGKRSLIDLLQVPLEVPTFRNLFISVLAESKDCEKVVEALEMGCLSFHERATAKEPIEREFEDFFELLELFGGDSTLIAAEYCRMALARAKKVEIRLDLEQNLLALYPASADLLLSLGEAQILNGLRTEATVTLHQASIINPRLRSRCQSLAQANNLNEFSQQGIAGSQNHLGIETCLIIDPDGDTTYNLTKLCHSMGVQDVASYEDGEAAWNWIQVQGEPSLILMEWRIQGISGPILAQRIRNFGFRQVPIIIVSSLLKQADQALLVEVGIDGVISKPFESADFYRCVIGAIQQHKRPTEQRSFEQKIIRNLESRSNFRSGETSLSVFHGYTHQGAK